MRCVGCLKVNHVEEKMKQKRCRGAEGDGRFATVNREGSEGEII